MVTQNAAADDGLNPPPVAHWVVFVCDEMRFGVPLERVSEILTPRNFTRLPGAGPAVCGLVGVHGRVVTVVDLGVLLGLRAAARCADHRLLLFEMDAHRLGGIVDQVVAIVPAQLERPESAGSAGVLGTAKTEEGEFTAIEPTALLHELLPL